MSNDEDKKNNRDEINYRLREMTDEEAKKLLDIINHHEQIFTIVDSISALALAGQFIQKIAVWGTVVIGAALLSADKFREFVKGLL